MFKERTINECMADSFVRRVCTVNTKTQMHTLDFSTGNDDDVRRAEHSVMGLTEVG